jgi:hypothetical protein
MVNPNRFYTYAYLREDRTPYYIGKGQGGRVYKKGKGEVNPPKDKSRIILLKQNLTEEKAFKHEKYMIAVFGRKDLGTGILYNRTNGGEGSSGVIHTPETRVKMSVAKKGKTFSPEHRANQSAAQKGKTHSPEARAKMSVAKKGKTFSPEHRANQSAARKGENNPNYGKSPSPETREKQSAAMKGRTPHNKGKSHSSETRAKMSGKMWITDGNTNHRILKTNIIPEGFRKGITRFIPSQDPSTNSLNVL